MLKKIGAMILVSVLVLSMAACGGTTPAPAPASEDDDGGSPVTPAGEPILIGHSAALTGGSALWGESEKNALDMEIEKINAAGGVLGRPLEIRRYDNKEDQTESVNVANKLIADGVCAIIGPGASGTLMAATSVTEPAKMIMIGTTTTNPAVTIDDNGNLHPYNFRAVIIDPYQGKVAADFAIKDLGSTRAAILMDIGDQSAHGLTEFFTKAYTEGGGEIVTTEAYRTGEMDYRAQLGKIKEADVDLLLLPNVQTDSGLAMKQARELGLECNFLGGDAWASIELIELGGEATEGSFFVNLATVEDPALAEWVAEYQAKWGKDPTMPNPVFAIDALYMIIDAIEGTGGTDPDAMVKHMENIKDLKVLTGTMSIDPETHNPVDRYAVIETVKDGKFAFYKGITG